jgi:hypothetical protein
MLTVSNAGYKEGLKHLSLTLISGSIVYHCKIPCRKCGQCQLCEVVKPNMETLLTVAMKQHWGFTVSNAGLLHNPKP